MRRLFGAPIAVALFLCALFAPITLAVEYPPGFAEEVAFSGLSQPTNIEFAPDGRVFVTEKSGVVKVFDNLGDATPDTVADLSGNTHNVWDRGMLGLAIDPDFPQSPYVYVMYTFDAGDSWGDDCVNPPGYTQDGCVVNGRISRLEVAPNNSLVGGETVMLEGHWCQQYPSHSIGDLEFDGIDRVLYATAGDGASFNFVDWGQGGGSNGSPTPKNPCGDSPVPVGGNQTSPTSEGGALRSQDARTNTDPTTYDGTVIAIDPDTFGPASGNPLIGGEPTNDYIIAIGLRNPFRATTRPGTHELWMGDVGWSTWEEIDRIVDGRDNVIENFGWPCYEGSDRQGGYDNQNFNLCESLYSDTTNPQTPPYYEYRHGVFIDPDPAPYRCSKNGSSAPGGLAFYTGANAYPLEYQDALFFADFSRDCLFVLKAGSNGLPDVSTRDAFGDAVANPVDVELGPDGLIYYVDINGRVLRITYSSSNLPPIAEVSATPSNGLPPLEVTLDASGSSDPDAGGTLSFDWDLDGDGAYDDATGPVTGGTINAVGRWTFRVRVSDQEGAFAIGEVDVTSGNTPPTAQITSPAPTFEWEVGEVINIQGLATDAQDGTLPAANFTWDVVLQHCPLGECHQHPVITQVGVNQISFVGPDHEYPSYLEIFLTVDDDGFPAAPGGVLSDSTLLTLQPETTLLSFDTSPTALSYNVSGLNFSGPNSVEAIVGAAISVSTSTPQELGGDDWEFANWSDGGAIAHTVIAPTADSTYTATFLREGCTADDATCDGIDDDCDGAFDEDYVETQVECGEGVCARVGQLACISGTPTDTCNPGAPIGPDTTCDGIDDDCDGETDEHALAPTGLTQLTVAATLLSWSEISDADHYAVVRGDLTALTAEGGDFSVAGATCLDPALAGLSMSEADAMTPGEVRWYLVRPNNCAGAGSFDSGGSGQVVTRDPMIGVCP